MSMNLHIFGSREIYIPSINKTETQKIHVDHMFQTPTIITEKAMDSNDPMKVYLEYVRSCCNGIKEYKSYVKELNLKLDEMKKNGYVITFEMM